jgi:hypothetical protein
MSASAPVLLLLLLLSLLGPVLLIEVLLAMMLDTAAVAREVLGLPTPGSTTLQAHVISSSTTVPSGIEKGAEG